MDTKFKKGTPSPLKGQTKETHPGIARRAAARVGKKRPELSGELHPNWKGGATGEAQQIRNSDEYSVWRASVFERDGYTCQQCGEKGGKLEAHHIRPFAEHPELRLDVSNGVTLCKACHRGYEKPSIAPRFSPEHRAKLSAAKKGRPRGPRGPMSDEAKAKLSASKKGQPAWNKGRTKETDTTVAHMAELASQRMQGKKGKDSPVWKRWHPEDTT